MVHFYDLCCFFLVPPACSLLFAFSQDRLEHLRKQCGPHVTAVAKDSVEGICTKIYHISAEYVRRIRQAHLNLLKECNITGKNKIPGEFRNRSNYYSPYCIIRHTVSKE